jgi:hypothetical protein
VGSFQGYGGVTAGDSTSSLVGLNQCGAESRLSLPSNDLPEDPKAGIVIVIQGSTVRRGLRLRAEIDWDQPGHAPYYRTHAEL